MVGSELQSGSSQKRGSAFAARHFHLDQRTNQPGAAGRRVAGKGAEEIAQEEVNSRFLVADFANRSIEQMNCFEFLSCFLF